MEDVRLDQEITVTEPGDRLGAVLSRFAKGTGVKLYAHVPLREVRVAVRYRGSIRGLMVALTHFFAVDKEHLAEWFPESNGGYTLGRSYEVERLVPRLRNERQTLLENFMDQAIRDGNKWLKFFGMLPTDQRRLVYGCGEVSQHVDWFGGRKYIDAVEGRNAAEWGDNSTATFCMRGLSPLARLFEIRITDNETGSTAVQGFAVAQFCLALAPEKQQQEWRLCYGDPAPAGGSRATLYGPKDEKPEEIARRDLLLRIAEKGGVNLIADDYGQTFTSLSLAGSSTVAEWLDAVCKFVVGSGETPDSNHGSFWRKTGDVYLVRSLAWPEEEAR